MHHHRREPCQRILVLLGLIAVSGCDGLLQSSDSPGGARSASGSCTQCSSGWLDGSALLTPVNREQGLRSDYEPTDLVTLPASVALGSQRLRKAAADALVSLLKAAYHELGADLYCASSYRSFATQCTLFASYAARDGCDEANTYSAQAGRSEHQLGTVCDLADATGEFLPGENALDEYLARRAPELGFVMSYPPGTSDVTGYISEPWHFRYLGRKAAAQLRERELAEGRRLSTHEFLRDLSEEERAALEEEGAGGGTTPADDCGGVSLKGYCWADGKHLTYCKNGKLVDLACSGENVCRPRQGSVDDFDCLPPPADGGSCGPVTAKGFCSADRSHLTFCKEGALKTIACSGENVCQPREGTTDDFDCLPAR